MQPCKPVEANHVLAELDLLPTGARDGLAKALRGCICWSSFLGGSCLVHRTLKRRTSGWRRLRGRPLTLMRPEPAYIPRIQVSHVVRAAKCPSHASTLNTVPLRPAIESKKSILNFRIGAYLSRSMLSISVQDRKWCATPVYVQLLDGRCRDRGGGTAS